MYTENNKKLAEAELGPIPIDDKSPWPYTDTTVEFKLLQTDAEINGEPLLSANASSLEVQQRPAYADHPVDYFVPDFGLDEDIIGVNDGLAWAQKDIGHTWTPTQDANGYWNVPEAAAADSYSYNGNSGFTNHLAGAVY